MAKTKALSRDQRKQQILTCFALDMARGGEGSLTVAAIAKDMKQSCSQKLRAMVNELVEAGYLRAEAETIPGCVGRRVLYSAAVSGAGYKAKKRRTLKINGQLSFMNEEG